MKCASLDVALSFILPHRAQHAKHAATTNQPPAHHYATLHQDAYPPRVSPKTSPGALKTRPRHGRIPISRLQMSEAWARIRAVSPIATQSDDSQDSTHEYSSSDKKVRWGVVYMCEFDPPSARTRRHTDKPKRH